MSETVPLLPARRPRASLALPVLGGLLAAAGYRGSAMAWPFPYTILVGFVPLLLWVDGHLDRGWRDVRRAGFAFGLALHLSILYWMLSMVAISFLGIFAYFGLALVFAIGTMLAVVVLWWVRRNGRAPFVILLPAVWLSLEWFQAAGDLRQTAQNLGHVFACLPFAVQFADLAGPYGVGLVVLVVNALVYGILAGAPAVRRRSAIAAALVVGAALAYDAWAWTHPPEARRSLRVALVQPNVPLHKKMDSRFDGWQWAILSRTTHAAARSHPDLIVWPETARPDGLRHLPGRPTTYALPEISMLAAQTGTTMLVGVEYSIAQGGTDWDTYNAAMVVHPDGRLDPTWSAKTYLVPFVEGVPFRAVLGPLLDGLGGGLRWLSGGFHPGPPATPLRVEDVRVGVTVCFEELFFDLHRNLRNAGADLQVIITNHAWFRRTFFQSYAAHTVSLRAIENRTSFVRVANTGISGFVDPLGRYHERTALFEEDVRVHDVPIVDTRTVYDRIGDVVATIAMIVLAAAIAAAGWRERRRGEPEGPRAQSPDLGTIS